MKEDLKQSELEQCSLSLVIREMRIKTIIRNHYPASATGKQNMRWSECGLAHHEGAQNYHRPKFLS